MGRAVDEVDGGAWCGGFAIDRVTGEAECVVSLPVPVPARDASANAAAARLASLPLKAEGLAGADGAEPPLLVAVSVEVRAAASCGGGCNPCGGGCNPLWWWLRRLVGWRLPPCALEAVALRATMPTARCSLARRAARRVS